MTLDQYLGTVAWLWIAVTIGMLLLLASKPIKNQKRVKRKWLFSIAFFFMPSMLFELLFEDESLLRMWVITIMVWCSYPLYLWVSSTFQFNVTYIG